MSKKRVLVIAGSDSSGGAGLEADQKVIAAHRCYALTATTALTAQNTLGVQDIHITPPEFVGKQINACLEDVGADVVKMGMLASAGTIEVVARALKKHHVRFIVLDPVMVSTSGSQLLPEAAVSNLRFLLLPMTTVLTPNVPEAKLLLSDAGRGPNDPKTLEDLIGLAKAVHKMGPEFVLLKGGHLPLKRGDQAALSGDGETVVDILFDGIEVFLVETPYLKSKNTHGTGCSLASAIACNLANGMDVRRAVRAAARYVEAGIKTSFDIGQGSGPINHFHSTYSLPFAPDRFLEYVLERPDVKEVWTAFTEHEFVKGMGDGTLPLENFKFYLIQDYLYLIQFARANALASYKSKTIDDIAMSANLVLHIQREMSLHIDYCKDFGLSKEDMEGVEESQACTAYSRYCLDIGQSEDWLALQMSLAPCLIGYQAVARLLVGDAKTVRGGNRYWKWIEMYDAEDYGEAVTIGSDLLERSISKQSPSRIEELVKIFIHATRMEIGFWDMGSVSSKVKSS